MKHTPTVDRPPGRLLRRIAECVASKATCDRVLFPLLADLEFEHAKARAPWARGFVRARGVVAFWQAFGVTSVMDSSRHLWTNAWGSTEEEGQATKRLLVRVGLGATVVTALLLGSEYSFHLGSVSFLLIPSMIPVALPTATLFAFALGTKAPADGQRKAALRVVLLASLATFATSAWLNPIANQQYVRRVYDIVAPESVGHTLSRGDREMTFDELIVRSSELRATGHGKEAPRFDLEWHKKPALGSACLALAFAGLAIASRLRRTVWRFVAAFAVYFVFYVLLRLGEQAARTGSLAPALAMWGPVLLIAAASVAVLTVSRRGVAAVAGR